MLSCAWAAGMMAGAPAIAATAAPKTRCLKRILLLPFVGLHFLLRLRGAAEHFLSVLTALPPGP
jgi:hypothetical protein